MPELVEWMTRIGNTAVHRAQEENRRLGIANVYVLNGKMIWELPNGELTTVRPARPMVEERELVRNAGK